MMVKCPTCGNNVRVVSFGSAFLAVCCGRIIYRGSTPPLTGLSAAGADEKNNVIFFDDRLSRT
jgi:hypothetical protein